MPARRGGFGVAADGGDRAAPLGAGEGVVHHDDEQHEEAEHPRHPAPLVEVPHDRLEPDGHDGNLQDQAGPRAGREVSAAPLLHRAQAHDEDHDSRQEREGVGEPVGDDEELAEADEKRAVGQVDRAGRAEHVELQAQQREQARERRDEARHPEARAQQRVDRADENAERQGGDDGDHERHALVHPEHADQRRADAAHRADREVDLAEHQHADDAKRDDAGGRAVEEQVDEVVARQEHWVEAGEHSPDEDEPYDDGQRAEVARPHAVEERGKRAADALGVRDAGVAAVEQRRAGLGARRGRFDAIAHAPCSSA